MFSKLPFHVTPLPYLKHFNLVKRDREAQWNDNASLLIIWKRDLFVLSGFTCCASLSLFVFYRWIDSGVFCWTNWLSYYVTGTWAEMYGNGAKSAPNRMYKFKVVFRKISFCVNISVIYNAVNFFQMHFQTKWTDISKFVQHFGGGT